MLYIKIKKHEPNEGKKKILTFDKKRLFYYFCNNRANESHHHRHHCHHHCFYNKKSSAHNIGDVVSKFIADEIPAMWILRSGEGGMSIKLVVNSNLLNKIESINATHNYFLFRN